MLGVFRKAGQPRLHGECHRFASRSARVFPKRAIYVRPNFCSTHTRCHLTATARSKLYISSHRYFFFLQVWPQPPMSSCRPASHGFCLSCFIHVSERHVIIRNARQDLHRQERRGCAWRFTTGCKHNCAACGSSKNDCEFPASSSQVQRVRRQAIYA